MIIQPYEHDCDGCIWVGWIRVKGGGKFGSDHGNMYYCPSTAPTSQGSVIIRFSDEPSDYWSCPIGGLVKGSLEVSDPLDEEAMLESMEKSALKNKTDVDGPIVLGIVLIIFFIIYWLCCFFS